MTDFVAEIRSALAEVGGSDSSPPSFRNCVTVCRAKTAQVESKRNHKKGKDAGAHQIRPPPDLACKLKLHAAFNCKSEVPADATKQSGVSPSSAEPDTNTDDPPNPPESSAELETQLPEASNLQVQEADCSDA